MKQLKLISLLTGSFITLSTSAHELNPDNVPTHLTINTAMSYQNKTTSSDAWMVPGILLGGEAIPRQQGAKIDDAQLIGKLVLQQQVSFHGKVGFHQHASDSELALEELWFKKAYQLNHSQLDFEIGLMATDTTTTANHDAGQSLFMTKPLLALTFFGGHHKDTGLKSKYYWRNVQVGLELWNGDSWPYTSAEGSQALYLGYQNTFFSVQTKTNLWYSHGTASQRQDLRYSTSHNHSSSITSAANMPESYFSGDIDMVGGVITLARSVSSDLSLLGEMEVLQSRQLGQLSDTSQSANIELHQTGIRTLVGVEWRNHSVAIQYEMLVVDNHFANTTSAFIDQQGVYNKNFEPKQTTFAYNWRWQNSVTFRLETLYDQTRDDKAQHVWSVGFTWQHNLI